YPGQQPRQVISLYDIPVASTLRETIEDELVGMNRIPNTYSALRKSTRKINIGVFGEASKVEGRVTAQCSSLSRIDPDNPDVRSSLSPVTPQAETTLGPRPPLTPLNQNLSLWRVNAQIVYLPRTVVRETSDVIHTFKNSSGDQTLQWELSPFAPAYVKRKGVVITPISRQVARGSQEVKPAGQSVFSVSPLKGTLQPGAVQKVCVKFSPHRSGSYNQVWTVVDCKQIQVTRFTVFAEAVHESPTRLGEDQPTQRSSAGYHDNAQCLEDFSTTRSDQRQTEGAGNSVPAAQYRPPTEGSELRSPYLPGSAQHDLVTASDHMYQEAETADIAVEPGSRLRPYWSRVDAAGGEVCDQGNPRVTSPALSSISGTSSAARRAGTTVSSSSASSPANSRNSSGSRSERPQKGLHLVHSWLEFPSVKSGSSSVHKLFIKNQSDQDAELTVDCEPQPPFLVKHLKFKVSCGKITIFPVTFKPRHVDKFKDKIVFRDSVTGKLLTATLTAESKAS
ncbi:centrosomal protein of 192 kDa, partial [Elysia marginata]